MDTEWIDAKDAQQCADFLVAATAHERAVAARRLQAVAHWAVLHDTETLHQPRDTTGRVLPGTEQAKQVGGDGTPEVAEFAIHELALLLGLPVATARNHLADTLDLAHRHPQLWERLDQTAHADDPGTDPALAATLPQAWQATYVARRCRTAGLSAEAARWVDARTTKDLGTIAWTRFTEKLDARIKAADPVLAERRRRQRDATRRVTVSPTNDDGLKTLTVQLPAAQIIVLKARLHQLALILQAHAADTPIGQLEADAAFLLTNPAEALRLLVLGATLDKPGPTGPASDTAEADADDNDPEHDDGHSGGDDDSNIQRHRLLDLFADRRIHPREAGPAENGWRHPFDDPIFGPLRTDRWLREHDAHQHEPPDPGTAPDPGYHPGPPPPTPAPAGPDPSPGDGAGGDGACPTCGHDPHHSTPESSAPTPVPVPVLATVPKIDPAKLRPTAVLYLHASAADFRHGHGLVRFENDNSALTHTEAVQLLGHCHVTLRPVIDLNQQRPTDAYETSTRLTEALQLLHPYTATPFSTTRSRSRHVDVDHTRPYTPGTPGQTRLDNLAPLGRGSHRYKTFANGVALAQPTLGVLLWRTKHGYSYQVDNHGTHPLGKMTTRHFHALVEELALPDCDTAELPTDPALDAALAHLANQPAI